MTEHTEFSVLRKKAGLSIAATARLVTDGIFFTLSSQVTIDPACLAVS